MHSDGFAGRTALVTGATRGIGRGVAEVLSRGGANVVLTSRRADAANAVAQDLNASAGANAGRCVGFGAHAVDETAASACIEHALAEFGAIDILVNNAGTNPAYGPLIDQDHARFSKTMDVNLWAPLLWTSLVAKAWMLEHGGAVINLASVGGIAIEPDLGVYNASKAALMHLTRQLALELAPSVRVNAVAPGIVRTKLAEALWSDNEATLNSSLPLGRIGEPSDVAAAVSFLASDDSSWITGTTLVIDGGKLLGDAASGR